jgi:hypothetical protein
MVVMAVITAATAVATFKVSMQSTSALAVFGSPALFRPTQIRNLWLLLGLRQELKPFKLGA